MGFYCNKSIGIALLLGCGLAMLLASPIYAASFKIGVDGDTPLAVTRTENITGIHVINIYLDFDDPTTDVASVFEGTFGVSVIGGGGTTSALSAPASSDWNFGCFAGATTVSCTSDNSGGLRLVGIYTLDIAIGDYLEISWVSGFAAKDISVPPYSLDVPIFTPDGTILFSIPEPGTIVLLAIGIAGVAITRQRRRI